MQYVIANRKAGKFTTEAKSASVAAFEAFSTRLSDAGIEPSHVAGRVAVRENSTGPEQPTSRIRIVELEPDRAEDVRASAPADVIIEPLLVYRPALITPFGNMWTAMAVANAATSKFGTGASLEIVVERTDGGKLPHAQVSLSLSMPGILDGEVLTAATDGAGIAKFTFPRTATPFAAVAAPYQGYWAMILRQPTIGAKSSIRCPKLPAAGPFGWWHQAAGAAGEFDATLGEGIRVTVIDTGCGRHTNLDHVGRLGAVVGNLADPREDATDDVDVHGTHVCGTIGARKSAGSDYVGMAPGAVLSAIRVFADAGGANQPDIAMAIEIASKTHTADLINLSLGGPRSELIEDRIADARERGTLCICAAGNSGGAPEHPAAFEQSIAISALGEIGWGPDGSLAHARIPREPSLIGRNTLFLANFSCRGAKIAAAGPGVGVIATVPARHGFRKPFAALDGTSMAAPMVTATLAVLLAESTEFRDQSRNASRAAIAEEILLNSCRNVGLPAFAQGRGLPRTEPIVG